MMTESVTFTQAAKRTLNKISRNRQHTSRREFGAAWAKWAKDRPYAELIAALGRVGTLLDNNEERPTTAALVAAMVAEEPQRLPCEHHGCNEPRKCLHYCAEHHQEICLHP